MTWAPEASDVLWSNLHVGKYERKFRLYFLNLLLVLVFLGIAFVLQKWQYEKVLKAMMIRSVGATGISKNTTMTVTDVGGNLHVVSLGRIAYGLSTYCEWAPAMCFSDVRPGLCSPSCDPSRH